MNRLLTLTLILAACSGDEEKTGTGDTGDTVDTVDTTEPPAVDEDALLAELTAELAEYPTWAQTPGWEGVVASAAGAHGPYVQIWYDDTALADLADPADGATSFKEGYAVETGGTPDAITAMRYAEGYGWYYAMFDAAGTPMATGRDAMCIGCHEVTGETGFLAP